MTHEFKNYIDLSQLEEIALGNGALEAKYMLLLITYARELEARNKQLDAALRRIIDHGMPSESDTTQTWLRCSMSVYRIARDAIEAWRNA